MTIEEYLKNRNIPPTSLEANSIREGIEFAVNKACGWLLHQEEMIGVSFEKDFIERFKEAVEE